MATLADQKIYLNIVNIRTWGKGAKAGLPPSAAYRYVFWEKPYVMVWFEKNYRHKLSIAATIAYSKIHSPGGFTQSPSSDWVKRNLPHVAFWLLFTDGSFAQEVYKRFKDELEEATAMVRAKEQEEDVVAAFVGFVGLKGALETF